jgi:hypothetical protein
MYGKQCALSLLRRFLISHVEASAVESVEKMQGSSKAMPACVALCSAPYLLVYKYRKKDLKKALRVGRIA